LRLLGRPLLLAIAVLLFAVACGGGEDIPQSDIVNAIPWKGNESLSYVLKDKKGNVVGHEKLSIAMSGGSTEMTQDFDDGKGATDVSVVTADSQTLKPQKATRKIENPKDKRELEATYSDAGVLIKDGDKQSGLKVPEHAYDNDSSLFLWRTLDFKDGYKGAYVSMINNRRTKQDVTLKVTGKETVKVPAGEFTAWKLEIEGENATQKAWFADTPTRPLVKYDNDRGLIFELEKAP
jgi:hypothetical protein